MIFFLDEKRSELNNLPKTGMVDFSPTFPFFPPSAWLSHHHRSASVLNATKQKKRERTPAEPARIFAGENPLLGLVGDLVLRGVGELLGRIAVIGRGLGTVKNLMSEGVSRVQTNG